jgi:hypothetical protein
MHAIIMQADNGTTCLFLQINSQCTLINVSSILIESTKIDWLFLFKTRSKTWLLLAISFYECTLYATKMFCLKIVIILYWVQFFKNLNKVEIRISTKKKK